MLRALCLAVFVLPLGAASADAPSDLGANAALKYWQAFATLPKFTDDEQKKLQADCLTMPLDAHAREMVTKADYALLMMHYGSALPHCAWGIGHEEGVYVRLPNADGARVLAALACLRARVRFEEGKSAEAIDDLLAAMTMGRQSTLAGTNIMLVVGYAIEGRVDEALAQNLPKLKADALKDLAKRLGALPAAMTPSAALATEEKFFLDWLIRRVKDAKDKESLLVALAFVGLEPEGQGRSADDKVRAFVELCGGNAEGIVKFAEETRGAYRSVAEKLPLPLDQFEKEFERELAKRASNPVFKMFFPAMDSVRKAQARIDLRRAMLAAAIAVRLDGRDALKDHPDPVMGGPFEYDAFEGGFELRSKFKGRDDKPISLTVGRRGS